MIVKTLSEISLYLTEDIIEKAFKKKTGSDDTVKSIKILRAAPAGEGLLSAVYRIQVNGYIYRTSFVVKGLVKDPVLLKSLNCQKYSQREVHFFKNLLPVLVKFQKSTGAKESLLQIIPKLYDCQADGKNDYILMEDLAEISCKSIPDNPSEHERDNILKTLAHFHAVSLAFRVKNPEEYNRLSNTLHEIHLSSKNDGFYVSFLENAIAVDTKVLSEYEDANSIYFKKFKEAVSNDAYGKLCSLVENRGDNSVWCHGDAWIYNFLCSKDKVVAIDFQIIRCASPATDLTYCIMTCGNLCKNKESFMNAVAVYYRAIDYYLTDMGIKVSEVFSLNTLYDEIKKFGKFGFYTSMSSIPLLSEERLDILESTKEKFPNMDKIPITELWKLSLIKEEYKLRLVNMIRVSIDVGLI